MSNTDSKIYFKSFNERDGGEAYRITHKDEFPEPLALASTPISRRGFLAAAGFTFAGATLFMGCERAPEERAISFLVQPEEIIPGKATYYATTCNGCSAKCGMLVKNRDGRPIKLEGNPEHPLSNGGLCAIGQASVLDLYDSQRIKQPLSKASDSDKAITWDVVDAEIMSKLNTIRNKGGSVRLLTRSVTSPSTKRIIDEFLKQFPDGKHVVYEPVSCSAILDAHEQTHGTRLLPRYRFDKAEVLVGLDADFLGTWISPVEYTAGWKTHRQTGNGDYSAFSFHVQFESRLSITGSKADKRVMVEPEAIGKILTDLVTLIAKKASVQFGDSSAKPTDDALLTDLAERLWQTRGRSLVVCGSQDVEVQKLCNYLNHLLDNYDNTLDIGFPSQQRADNDAEFAAFYQELQAGKINVLIMHGVNPVYDLPTGNEFADLLDNKVELVISCATRENETTEHAAYICPDHHYLEAWGDEEPVHSTLSFQQPAIAPLGNTRAFIESLSIWCGKPRKALDIIKGNWSNQSDWDKALHDGVWNNTRQSVYTDKFQAASIKPVTAAENQVTDNMLTLVLYQKAGMRDTQNAGNPWLQEMPDPITKVTWDNYASLAPATAKRLRIKTGDVVTVKLAGNDDDTTGGVTIELPALIQPGQHHNVVAVALTYGAVESKRFAGIGPQWLQGKPTVGPNDMVGINASGFITKVNSSNNFQYSGATVQVDNTSKKHELACTQDYHYITVPDHLAPAGHKRRPMIQETTVSAVSAAIQHDEIVNNPDHNSEPAKDLWPVDHPYNGHHWGMAIDLTACTGCSACALACQVENNIPVVGKSEIANNREMFWMRIDRYYADVSDNQGGVDVAHQPMLCHHCDNAPCETVCPVLATVHSEEGLNQQVYNRCVGTRYCANNCPYKVRRFNWFNYKHEDALENMVLNPDVTVRTRGIMEKCSFCVQRIQEAKINAKSKGTTLVDNDIQTACQQSCPANAIIFGDMNDPKSKVTQLINSSKHYRVLEEINIRPSVGYLKLVRNRKEERDQKEHG